MVAASVLQSVGLDVWPQTAGYLVQRVPFDEQTRAVQRYGLQIDQIVEKLSKALRS